MCGIISSITKEPSLDNVRKIKLQYAHQDHRGLDGYGFVAIQNGELVYARSVYIEEIMEELDKLKETTLVIFHHRIPTCNLNTPDANHPLFITSKKNLDYKYFIVHNGSIQNSKTLRPEHETEGFKYKSEVSFSYGKASYVQKEHTDSESLGIEMAKYVEGKQTRIKARGGVAMFMLQVDSHNRPLNFYYFRNSNPIKWFTNNASLFLASEAKGSILPDNELFKLDLTTWETFHKPAKLSELSEIGAVATGNPIPFVKLERRPKSIVTEIVSNVKKNSLAPNTANSLKDSPKLLEQQKTSAVVTMEKDGNTLIVRPREGMGSLPLLGFNKIRQYPNNPVSQSPLHRSLRTFKDVDKELDEAKEQMWAYQGDLMTYLDQHGVDDSEAYDQLVSDYNASREIVKDIELELEEMENIGSHIRKHIPA